MSTCDFCGKRAKPDVEWRALEMRMPPRLFVPFVEYVQGPAQSRHVCSECGYALTSWVWEEAWT